MALENNHIIRWWCYNTRMEPLRQTNDNSLTTLDEHREMLHQYVSLTLMQMDHSNDQQALARLRKTSVINNTTFTSSVYVLEVLRAVANGYVYT